MVDVVYWLATGALIGLWPGLGRFAWFKGRRPLALFLHSSVVSVILNSEYRLLMSIFVPARTNCRPACTVSEIQNICRTINNF